MRRRTEDWWLWLALAVAFSPVLHNLLEHWIDDPWSLYSVSFVLLLVLAVRSARPVPPRLGPGLGLLAAASAGQIFAFSASIPAVGRPLAALAVVGMIVLRGTAPIRSALLTFWIVPIPAVALDIAGGAAATRRLYEWVAGLMAPLGVSFHIEGRELFVSAEQLSLSAHQNGLLLAVHLCGLAWYIGVRRGLGLGDTIRWIIGFALLAVPIQLGVISTTVLLMQWGSPAWMLRAVDAGSWLLPLLFVLAREHLWAEGADHERLEQACP